MSADPFLGGATIEVDPRTATTAQLAKLKDGGVNDRHHPKTEITNKYAAQPGLTPQQRAQAPTVNRNLVIAGYKGKADAWIRCLKEVLHVNGGQTDRKFYLALDPREADRQAELMEVGSQAFSTFVVFTYRDSLPDPTPIGLPAARNLHSFVGRVMEEGRNVGPILIALPFHTLMPGAFDIIERHYTHAAGVKGISFLGYEIKKSDGKRPGSAIVLPPLWARHPDFPLAKGLSQFTAGDLDYIKDEILRAMRVSDVMIGHGMKPGAMTAIQTFPSDEIMTLAPTTPPFNPAGRPAPPVQAASPNNVPGVPQTTGYARSIEPTIANSVPIATFDADEKSAVLVLISQLGMAAIKTVDAARYGATLVADSEFADATVSKAQGYKLRAGKAAKAK